MNRWQDEKVCRGCFFKSPFRVLLTCFSDSLAFTPYIGHFTIIYCLSVQIRFVHSPKVWPKRQEQGRWLLVGVEGVLYIFFIFLTLFCFFPPREFLLFDQSIFNPRLNPVSRGKCALTRKGSRVALHERCLYFSFNPETPELAAVVIVEKSPRFQL